MGRLFGTDGVRGLANTDLTAEQRDLIATRLGTGRPIRDPVSEPPTSARGPGSGS